MERVGTLLQKLQEQLGQQAGTAQMLLTVQQLQAELLHLQQQETEQGQVSKIVVDMPPAHPTKLTKPLPEAIVVQETIAAEPASLPALEIVEPSPVAHMVANATDAPPMAEGLPIGPVETDDKIVEMLVVDEAEVEAELEEIKRNAAAKNNMSVHYKPLSLPDEALDLPETPPAKQEPAQPAPAKELNEVMATTDGPSLNDKLKQRTTELADQLAEPPIKDLKKAIGINDKYLYINDLFRGDETMYERSIKTINSFTILPEAEYWIQRELKVKLGWSETNETVKQFNQLIKRRFS